MTLDRPLRQVVLSEPDLHARPRDLRARHRLAMDATALALDVQRQDGQCPAPSALGTALVESFGKAHLQPPPGGRIQKAQRAKAERVTRWGRGSMVPPALHPLSSHD